MRTTRTLPSNIRLIGQFLLLGFFLTPVMAVGQDSDSDWSVDEQRQDDVWTIRGGDDIVRASVNGKITHGDRLRVILRPSDRCRNAILATSFYTYSKEPDIGSLRNVPVVFQIYDGEMEEGTIDFMIPLFNRHMAWINLFNLPLPAIKEMFEIMNKRSDEIQITLKNSNTLETEKYFDIPTNTWSLEGSMEALDRAEQLCLRMVEEITLTPGMAVGQDSDFPETLRSAEEGDAIAQYNLALMYDNGEGVPEDDAEAVKWYQLAAEQGAASAQYNLALMYATGEGVPEDDAEAVKWYQLAAEQGDAQAQTNLGVMYATGEGVPINYVTAYAWMNIAADSGHEDSIELRSIVEKRMTPSQIAEAQKLSTEIYERIQQGNK